MVNFIKNLKVITIRMQVSILLQSRTEILPSTQKECSPRFGLSQTFVSPTNFIIKIYSMIDLMILIIHHNISTFCIYLIKHEIIDSYILFWTEGVCIFKKHTSKSASANITILDMLALVLVSSSGLPCRLPVLQLQFPVLC